MLSAIGDQILETPNVIRSRGQETSSYKELRLEFLDSDQLELIRLLESHWLTVVSLKLRHLKMLWDGFHGVTLDMRRIGTLQRYFN